jgi:hypothetical protein
MKHISEVWEFLDQFHTKEDLEEAFGEIPNKFGSFEIVNDKTYEEDGYFEICNSYWDDNVGGYDYDYHTVEVNL